VAASRCGSAALSRPCDDAVRPHAAGCVVQVWDTRTKSSIIEFKEEHDDFIADFAVDASGFNLVTAG
jgi:hypothetical protein